MPACYKWLISYSKTVMTQHGCAASAFTSSAQRSWGTQTSIPPELYRTATVTVAVTTTDTPTLIHVPPPKKQNLGAIIGGTIGGCTLISLLIFFAILLHRRRKARNFEQAPQAQYHGPIMTFDPMSPSYATNGDDKMWQQRNAGPVTRESDAMPQYPGMGTARYGVMEVDGVQRPVEVEGEENTRGYKRSELH
jgi:hypothetical protein